jgi:ribosomal protein RSM22 (predicted rRNA methylase)
VETLGAAVAELSRRFTRERCRLNQPYFDQAELGAAYLQYFLPVNLSKIQILLEEMPAPQTKHHFSVLDLGSGPGTGTLAVLDWWRQRNLGSELSVVAIDSSSSALGQAERLWSQYCRAAGVEGARLWTHQSDVEKGAWHNQAQHRAPYDLIILANCLNELHADARDPLPARADLVSDLLSLLAPHGTVMVVEPALRDTSRALHQVRDRLLQEKRCTVYSPCLHEGPCPALILKDDWCHEERPWVPPACIQTIDREVGFIKDALKFSYLLLRKDGMTMVVRHRDIYRVVSELRVFKGESRVWVCNELGRSEIGRQDRMQAASNEAWDRLERGTIVRLGGLQRKEGAALQRVPVDGTVEIIQPA